MKSFLYTLYQRVSNPIVAQWISESKKMNPIHSVYGIEFIGPCHYLPVLEKTFYAFSKSSPDVFHLIKNQITTIYTHPYPMNWLGFGNNCAFITSELEQQTPFVWIEFAGFLASTAKINELLSQNRIAVLFIWGRWSRSSSEVNDLEEEVKIALEVFQGIRGHRK